MSFILMSGPTGLLGEYLLKDLLLAGWNVAVLCRSARGSSPEDRIEDLLHGWEDRLGFALPRPVVIESDLTQDYLGVSEVERRWIKRHCKAFLHNAASLTFDSNREDGEPWLSNLIGTHHAIQLCKFSNIRTIFHVSTAYVCGRRTGKILESELDLGQSFATEYEASKCASEIEWNHSAFENLTILRPAIIVGDSETGYTSTYHGFYAPLKSMAMLLSQGARNGMSTNGDKTSSGNGSHVPLEPMLAALGLSGSEEKNFVPVEWVARVITAVVSNRAAWNQVYHLTPTKRVSALDAAIAMQRSLVKHFALQEWKPRPDRSGTEAKSESTWVDQMDASTKTDWSHLGKAFSSQVSAYQEYWRDDPIFDARNRLEFAEKNDRSDLDCPILDGPILERLCDFALQSGFGWPKRRISLREDSLENWLAERSLQENDVEATMVQLNVLGPGGGLASIGFDSSGRIVFEQGDAVDAPRVTFGLEDLRRYESFSDMESNSRIWVQLPEDPSATCASLKNDYDKVIRFLDRIALGVDSTNSKDVLLRH